MKRYLLYLFIIVSFLSSCVGEDFVEEIELFEAKFSITNGSISGVDSLLVGDSIEYTTAFFNRQGKEEGADVSWESSRPSVATVDQNGKVIALSEGATNITAKANGLEAAQLVVVQKFERIEISSSKTNLVLGEEITIAATYYNKENKPTAVALNWSSSSTSVATVNSSGKLTATGTGSTQVMASFNGINSNVLSFEVVNVERIELSSSKTTLIVGEELTINSIYFDQQGNQASATLNWMSSNTGIATVDNMGKVSAVSKGESQITASGNGVTSNVITIHVYEDTMTVSSIAISTTASSVEIGSSLSFTAESRNVNGNLLNNIPIQWSSSDPTVLSVDANGVVTGLAAGSSDVIGTAQGVQSAAVNILVTAPVTNVRSGSFQNANGYTVNGNVEIRRMPDNSIQLNFTGFSSDPSGNLFIHLSNSANSVSGGVDLGRLNFRSGSFTVAVPANVGVTDFNYVVIWCRGVGQSFGAAQFN